MLRISKEFVTDNCSPKNPPVARCQSGDTVMFETRDCYDDRLCGDGTVIEPEKALENPATGPLFVEGAEPGDVLTYCQKWVAFQEYWAQVLPAIPVYSNAYFDFHTPLLQDYFISSTATWGQAVVEAYLGDPAEEEEENIEDDEEMGEGGIIIID